MEKWLCPESVEEARLAASVGADALFVDWEVHGKKERQSGFSTSLNTVSFADTVSMRGATDLPIVVRTNRYGAQRTPDEVARALDAGADRVLLACPESAQEVERFLRLVDGRAEAGIMIETQPLLDDLAATGSLPWSFAYIGLNDLMISRGARHIWTAVLDGTVQGIFRAMPGKAIGFGGLTRVGAGDPIPFDVLAAELVAHGSRFAMLRRSFHRDVAMDAWAQELGNISDLLRALALADQDHFVEQRKRFVAACAQLDAR